ncbi:MAG TPA: alpha-amylase family glycosyl hydrolase [Gaiellaceae bacterium]|nr:alpha-amylase family glycosyl hydrolase [Gaiellaceae bacterium]
MPDRYANGDPSNDTGGLKGPSGVTGFDPADAGYYHGGDLKGLDGHLQRIKDLGFTALWVTPVLKQDPVESGSAAYHGYWGLDFTTVDPHLGTDADFKKLVDDAHALGLKVYLDVVVNHTADMIELSNGATYSDIPFRNCHGSFFRADRYVTARKFPCLAARYMPEVPYVPPADRHLKKPAWLNDPLNYHDRGNIDFGSCSQQCFEQGDFYGLDDLFTEKPNVMNGLAQIYASWIQRFHVDGFRVDTAKHVNAAFFRLWVPKIRAAARSAGIADFPIFGEVTLNDSVDLADFVRTRGLPQVLDFPFQQVAASYAAGATGAKGLANRLADDDYFRTANGVDPAFPTFLGNHDMGRGAQQILSQAPGLSGKALLQHVELGYDLLYLLRGAPVVQWGDEVGMIGSGGDKAAREDMFPTQVQDWRTETRVGSPPIGKGSSFDVVDPLQAHLRQLAVLRDAHPELSTGASLVRKEQGAVLVVSRIDLATGREVVVAFNNGASTAKVTVPVATPTSTWSVAFGTGSASGGLTLAIPPVSALVAVPGSPIPKAPPASPRLTAKPDDLTQYVALTATVPGAPVSVWFATRRRGGGWQRVAVDDSVPYRGFVDPARFKKRERVDAVAVARGLDGSVSVSRVVTFTPRP